MSRICNHLMWLILRTAVGNPQGYIWDGGGVNWWFTSFALHKGFK